MNNKFSIFINKWMNKTIRHFTKLETPSTLLWLIKKYPKHRYIWWFLFQLKENSMFIMLCFVIYAVTHWCNPYLMCEPCLNITRGIGLPDDGLINFNYTLFKQHNFTMNLKGG